MKIQIKEIWEPTLWYGEYKGEIFDVIDVVDDYFIVGCKPRKGPSGCMVKKKHCTIVEEPESRKKKAVGTCKNGRNNKNGI